MTAVEWWQLAAAANGVVGLAYFCICLAILVPLVRAGELRSNKLGAATALIFLACAVHHGAHTVQLFLPAGGGAADQLAIRAAVGREHVTWDVVSAAAGVYYWTLRRNYDRLLLGGKLFEDQGQRQREALEINDTIVQRLVAAQLAHRLGRAAEVERALDGALDASRSMVNRLLREAGPGHRPDAGDFVRRSPASLAP